MNKIINLPVLLLIFCGFIYFGFSSLDTEVTKRKIEHAVLYGHIGLNLALCLFAIRLLRPKQVPSGAGGIMRRQLRFAGLQILILIIVTGIFLGVGAINFGEEFGGLFMGDSGFAIFEYAGHSIAIAVLTFIGFLILQVTDQNRVANPKA